MKRLAGLTALALIIGNTTGCSWLWGKDGYFRDRGTDYLDSHETAPMKVPEGLQSKPLDPLLPIPMSVADSHEKAGEFEVPRPVALADKGANSSDYSLQKSGDARWLLAQRPPAEVWPVAHQFFQDNGFAFAEEKPQTGEFSTRWQPLAQVSAPLARRLSSRIAGVDPSSETRVRVRIEPGVQTNTSEIYVLSETRPAGSSSASQDWPSKPAVPALDAALLDEMLASMASSAEKGGSVSLLAAHSTYDTPGSVVLDKDGNGNPMLTIDSDLDRAWISVGRALDNADIQVDDINRSLGVYYVNVAEGAKKLEDAKKPGFFGRMFGASEEKAKAEEEAKAKRYQVRLTSVNNTVQVTLDKDINTSAPVDVAQSVLEKIQESMRNALRGPGERKPGQFGLGDQL